MERNIMKEHPIIFNSEMIKAVLDGRKTQTRRIVKWPLKGGSPNPILRITEGISRGTYIAHDGNGNNTIFCPYGKVGDKLWVREAFCCGVEWDYEKPSELDPLCGANDIWFPSGQNEVENPDKAEKPEGYGKTRPSIFMPRWASRITLEITAIRVERVKDMTEGDAIAEGIDAPPMIRTREQVEKLWLDFKTLWDSINKKRGYGWESNPWVWVVEFKVIK